MWIPYGQIKRFALHTLYMIETRDEGDQQISIHPARTTTNIQTRLGQKIANIEKQEL